MRYWRAFIDVIQWWWLGPSILSLGRSSTRLVRGSEVIDKAAGQLYLKRLQAAREDE